VTKDIEEPSSSAGLVAVKPEIGASRPGDTLPRLTHDVVFVCRYPDKWSDLLSAPCVTWDLDAMHDRIITNEDCWTIATYVRLRHLYSNIYLTDRFMPGKICVVSSLDLRVKDFPCRSFVVGCRSDGYEPVLCDFAVVQNPGTLRSRTDVYIPHWPQPGLIPRDAARDVRIENMSFKGWLGNLHESFRTPEFEGKLRELGVRLVLSGKSTSAVHWNDYSRDDLFLAARDLTEFDAKAKPASKLINAWNAGVPALLGPEPAFLELRRSELDYIEVIRPEDVIEAIRRLRDNPSLYRAMIANGRERGEEFSKERMIRMWVDALSGPIAQAYESWLERSQFRHFVDFALRIPRYRKAKATHLHHRDHGRRVLTGIIT